MVPMALVALKGIPLRLLCWNGYFGSSFRQVAYLMIPLVWQNQKIICQGWDWLLCFWLERIENCQVKYRRHQEIEWSLLWQPVCRYFWHHLVLSFPRDLLLLNYVKMGGVILFNKSDVLSVEQSLTTMTSISSDTCWAKMLFRHRSIVWAPLNTGIMMEIVMSDVKYFAQFTVDS